MGGSVSEADERGRSPGTFNRGWEQAGARDSARASDTVARPSARDDGRGAGNETIKAFDHHGQQAKQPTDQLISTLLA